jgi:hypothetical protein
VLELGKGGMSDPTARCEFIQEGTDDCEVWIGIAGERCLLLRRHLSLAPLSPFLSECQIPWLTKTLHLSDKPSHSAYEPSLIRYPLYFHYNPNPTQRLFKPYSLLSSWRAYLSHYLSQITLLLPKDNYHLP